MSETLKNNTEQAPSTGAGETEYTPFDKQAAEEARAQRVAKYKAEHPDVVEDVDKAHFMALAGDHHETEATLRKKEAEEMYQDTKQGFPEERHRRAAAILGQAKRERQRAHQAEDEAGEFYDEMKQV